MRRYVQRLTAALVRFERATRRTARRLHERRIRVLIAAVLPALPRAFTSPRVVLTLSAVLGVLLVPLGAQLGVWVNQGNSQRMRTTSTGPAISIRQDGTGAILELLGSDGTNRFRILEDGTCEGDGCGSGGGAGVPVADTTALVEGSADDTKLLRLEVDGLTTGTTRVWTAPDADLTVVGLDTSQTLTGKTLDGNDNTLNLLLASQVEGVLDETNGGTGQSSLTTGDVLYASAANTLAKLAIGTEGQALLVSAGGVPEWATLPGGGDALTSGTLAQFAATTSAQLFGVLSNETGSASGTPLAVFNQAPVLDGPLLNGYRTAFAAKTSNFTFAASEHFVTCDASGTSVTVTGTLPTAASIGGRVYTLKRIDADTDGSCVIDGNGAETIDGAASLSVGIGDAITVVSDGTNWVASAALGTTLADPDADRIVFWDDSASAFAFLTVGSGLSLTDTTLTASGGGLGSNLSSTTNDLTSDNDALVFAGTAESISLTFSSNALTVGTSTGVALVDFGALGAFEVPNGAAPTVDAFGELAADNDLWDTGRGALLLFDGTAATALVGVLVSDTPTDGQVPTWNTGGTITWEDAGAGGGGSPGGASGDVQYNDGASGFGAEAAFNYNATTDILTLGALTLSATSNQIVIPDSDGSHTYTIQTGNTGANRTITFSANNNITINQSLGTTETVAFSRLTTNSGSATNGVLVGGSSGVRMNSTTTGVVYFEGLGSGADEVLTLDLDGTANTAVFGTTSSIAEVDFTTMNVDAAGYLVGGTAGVTVTSCTQWTLGICTAGTEEPSVTMTDLEALFRVRDGQIDTLTDETARLRAELDAVKAHVRDLEARLAAVESRLGLRQ